MTRVFLVRESFNFKCLVNYLMFSFEYNSLSFATHNLLLRVHWQRRFKPRLMYLFIFLKDLLIKRIFVSSAKWCTELCSLALLKSLMCRRNSNGPKTDPCGTPFVIFSFLGMHSLILVYWYLSVSHLFV